MGGACADGELGPPSAWAEYIFNPFIYLFKNTNKHKFWLLKPLHPGTTRPLPLQPHRPQPGTNVLQLSSQPRSTVTQSQVFSHCKDLLYISHKISITVKRFSLPEICMEGAPQDMAPGINFPTFRTFPQLLCIQLVISLVHFYICHGASDVAQRIAKYLFCLKL